MAKGTPITERTGKIATWGTKPKEASPSASCHSRNKGIYKGSY